MIFINTLKNKEKLSVIYIYIYSFFLSLSILKISNLSTPIIHIGFDVMVLVLLSFNILTLVIFNKDKFIFPLIFLICYVSFVILFKIKIATLQEISLLLLCCNVNLVKDKKFIKYNILFTIFPFILVIILNIVGLIPNVSYSTFIPGLDKGNGLGFAHPNITGEIVISIIISVLLYLDYNIRHKNNFFYEYICVIVGSLIVSVIFYKITNCRELLLFDFIVFILLFFINISYVRKIVYVLLIPLIIIIPSLTIYWDYNYNLSSSFYVKLNKLFSYRISMQNIIIRNHPFKLFTSLNDVAKLHQANTIYGESNFILDNSFVNMIELFGIIGLLIAAYIILKIAWMAIQIRSYILCVLLLALIVCNCIESSLFNTYLDAPLLFTCLIYYSQTKRVKNIN